MDKTEKLIFLAETEEIEEGYSTDLQEFIEEELEKDKLSTMTWVTTVFIDNFNNEKILNAILYALSHIDYNKIIPHAPLLAIVGIASVNLYTNDLAVKCFDYWNNKEATMCLKYLNIDHKPKWFKDYVKKIIQFIIKEE